MKECSFSIRRNSGIGFHLLNRSVCTVPSLLAPLCEPSDRLLAGWLSMPLPRTLTFGCLSESLEDNKSFPTSTHHHFWAAWAPLVPSKILKWQQVQRQMPRSFLLFCAKIAILCGLVYFSFKINFKKWPARWCFPWQGSAWYACTFLQNSWNTTDLKTHTQYFIKFFLVDEKIDF